MKRKIYGHIIAKILYFFNFKYKCSTSIADETTYGYGKLSDLGFWQFPLYFKG